VVGNRRKLRKLKGEGHVARGVVLMHRELERQKREREKEQNVVASSLNPKVDERKKRKENRYRMVESVCVRKELSSVPMLQRDVYGGK